MDLAYYQDYDALERTHWWFVIRGQLIQRLTELYATKKHPLRILNVGVATECSTESSCPASQVRRRFACGKKKPPC